MKILIITQTIDEKDPVLGFFVRWIEEFAKNCEVVHAVALNVGEYALPENVTVHCLGKSEGKGKLTWLWRLWSLSWRLRKDYDATFVHMNPEYVLFGSPLWKLLGKKILLWYAHGTVSAKLRLAVILSSQVFTSTEKGFRINTAKRHIVGQGIDTVFFKPAIDKLPNEKLELLTVGRISPAKNLIFLISTCAKLKQKGIPFHFTIVGEPQSNAERAYKTELLKYVAEHNLESEVSLVGAVSQKGLPKTLTQRDVFISAGATGSLDKALLEAVACGIITLSSNEAFRDFANTEARLVCFSEGNEAELVELLSTIHTGMLQYAPVQKSLMEKVKHTHSLQKFIPKLITQYESKR